MSDTSPSNTGSDQADPEEIVDAEILPDERLPVAPPTADPLPVAPIDIGYTAGGVPTFESVREKIETRYGTSVGSAELASETAQGRRIEEQYEARQQAAHHRLEQIRASMRDESDHA